jgi:hypothetical protein
MLPHWHSLSYSETAVAQTELANLAAAYLRLAEQAEKNSELINEFYLPAEEDDPKLKR